MGISRSAAGFLIREAKARPFSGRVLTLGVQKVFLSPAKLHALAAEHGFALREIEPATVDNEGYISDIHFFRSIGFEEVIRTDHSDYENPDFLFDLNSAGCPSDLEGSFDAVVDGGTIEHVFHLPNSLRNIFSFLKVGGRAIHLSPSSNHVDHGFYMFSPTLFWDFYSANGFEINKCQFFRYTKFHDTDPWIFGDYVPGCLDDVSFGGLGGGLYGVAVIAAKTEQSTGDHIPQQGAYVATWQKQARQRKKVKFRKLRRRGRRIWRHVLVFVPASIRIRADGLARFPLKVTDRL